MGQSRDGPGEQDAFGIVTLMEYIENRSCHDSEALDWSSAAPFPFGALSVYKVIS